MGYLQDLRAQLIEKLKALDEKSRKEVADFVANVVLESYRNGQKSRPKSAAPKRPSQKQGA